MLGGITTSGQALGSNLAFRHSGADPRASRPVVGGLLSSLPWTVIAPGRRTPQRLVRGRVVRTGSVKEIRAAGRACSLSLGLTRAVASCYYGMPSRLANRSCCGPAREAHSNRGATRDAQRPSAGR